MAASKWWIGERKPWAVLTLTVASQLNNEQALALLVQLS